MRINLKKARQNKGFTQLELAKLSNISERQYRRIELEEQTPSVDTALLIAQALNTTVEELFPLSQDNSSDTNPSKE